jgi:hypothetical protein
MRLDSEACRCFEGGLIPPIRVGFRAIGQGYGSKDDYREFDHEGHPGWCITNHEGHCNPEHIPIRESTKA